MTRISASASGFFDDLIAGDFPVCLDLRIVLVHVLRVAVGRHECCADVVPTDVNKGAVRKTCEAAPASADDNSGWFVTIFGIERAVFDKGDDDRNPGPLTRFDIILFSNENGARVLPPKVTAARADLLAITV